MHLLLLKHVQHALGDEEAAKNINGCKEGGCRSDHDCGAAALSDGLQDSANDDDATDSVGDTHQWRMQSCGNAPDNLPAHKAGQHEDCQVL